MGLGIVALAAVVAGHAVAIEHPAGRIDAEYQARTEIKTRTIGAYAPNRMDGRRCLWTATVVVDRQLASSPALSRTVSRDPRLTGSVAGPCSSKTGIVAREVARHDADVRAHVLAVAEQDRARLLAELDAARDLASD